MKLAFAEFENHEPMSIIPVVSKASTAMTAMTNANRITLIIPERFNISI